MSKSGVLAGTDVTKALFAIAPTMAGFVVIPTLGGCAVGGWLTGAIFADVSTDLGKERGKSFSDAIRNHSLDGRGVIGSEGRGPRVSSGFFLGFFVEGALVVDEGLKFCLCDIFFVNIFDPRAVECVISPSPKRVDQGNEGGLSIKFLDCNPSGK